MQIFYINYFLQVNWFFSCKILHQITHIADILIWTCQHEQQLIKNTQLEQQEQHVNATEKLHCSVVVDFYLRLLIDLLNLWISFIPNFKTDSPIVYDASRSHNQSKTDFFLAFKRGCLAVQMVSLNFIETLILSIRYAETCFSSFCFFSWKSC